MAWSRRLIEYSGQRPSRRPFSSSLPRQPNPREGRPRWQCLTDAGHAGRCIEGKVADAELMRTRMRVRVVSRQTHPASHPPGGPTVTRSTRAVKARRGERRGRQAVRLQHRHWRCQPRQRRRLVSLSGKTSSCRSRHRTDRLPRDPSPRPARLGARRQRDRLAGHQPPSNGSAASQGQLGHLPGGPPPARAIDVRPTAPTAHRRRSGDRLLAAIWMDFERLFDDQNVEVQAEPPEPATATTDTRRRQGGAGRRGARHPGNAPGESG